MRKIAASVTESLRDHPIAISLLALNVIFLIASAWTLHEIASNARNREASLHSLLRDCIEERKP